MTNSDTTVKYPVRFTDSAIKELKRLQKEQADRQLYLRIGAKGGGCSGLSYVLAFDEKSDKDQIYEIEGVTCIINPAHLIYLSDMEIDWQGGLNSRGFTFQNPNATENCGCGSSFAV